MFQQLRLLLPGRLALPHLAGRWTVLSLSELYCRQVFIVIARISASMQVAVPWTTRQVAEEGDNLCSKRSRNIRFINVWVVYSVDEAN